MKHSNKRPGSGWWRAIAVVGFVAWSTAMVVVGSITTEFGFSQSQAATAHSLVRLDRDRLSGKNLGDFAPYEPESGDLMARGHVYFDSEDGNLGIGVWESKPGEMTYADLAYDELMYVLDGGLVLTDTQGNAETYGPGEGVVLPKGWSGTLGVPEGGLRKIWVSYMGGKK